MIYIVTWIAVSLISVPCGNKYRNVNEFGFKSPVEYFTLQSCFDTDNDTCSRTFQCRKEAEDFIERMPKEIGGITFGNSCKNIKLDSADVWLDD